MLQHYYLLNILDKAQRMAALAGGKTALIQKATQALEAGDYQWALELTHHLTALNFEIDKTKNIRYKCLKALGERQSNPNARNYYLSQALELKGKAIVPEMEIPVSVVETIPIESIFKTLSVSLKAEDCLDYQKNVSFKFTDTNQIYTLIIRNGILEVQAFKVDESDIEVITDTTTWRALAAGLVKPASVLAKGKLKVKGGLLAFKQFMNLFEEKL